MSIDSGDVLSLVLMTLFNGFLIVMASRLNALRYSNAVVFAHRRCCRRPTFAVAASRCEALVGSGGDELSRLSFGTFLHSNVGHAGLPCSM